jgi:hypothetical protein
VLEEKSPRYMGVSVRDAVVLTLTNVEEAPTEHAVQIHPQKAEMGSRTMYRCNKVGPGHSDRTALAGGV